MLKKVSGIKLGLVASFIFIVVVFATTAASASVCSSGTSIPPFLADAVEPNVLFIIDNSASMYDLLYAANTADCYDGPEFAKGQGNTWVYKPETESYDPTISYSGYFEYKCYDSSGIEEKCTSDSASKLAAWYSYNIDLNTFEIINDNEVESKCQAATHRKTVTVNGTNKNNVCVKLGSDGTAVTYDYLIAQANFLNWVSASKMDAEKNVLTGGKYENGKLVLESRGCLNSRYIKQTSFDVYPNADSRFLTMGVRPSQPEEETITQTDPQVWTTLIELFPPVDGGFNQQPCQDAIDEIRSEKPNLGNLKGYIDSCLGDKKSSDPEFHANAAFNQSVQTCWSIVKHYDPVTDSIDDYISTGDVSRIINACEAVYEDDGEPGVVPSSIGSTYSGYVCFGNSLEPADAPVLDRGFVGRCWDDSSVSWRNNGKIQTPGWIVNHQTCAKNALIDFCGFIDVPEVVDPSDQASGGTGDATGDYWNLPAILIGDAVVSQLGDPLLTMEGKIAKSDTPSGIIARFSESARVGVKAFNKFGSASECDPTVDNQVKYFCDSENNRDGAKLLVPIGKDINSLTYEINNIKAETWTPLAEAMYNAIGYYQQDTSMRINSEDFDTLINPVEDWCQSNNIILITDGSSTADLNQSMENFVALQGYNSGTGRTNILDGSTYLSDLSCYARNNTWTLSSLANQEESQPINTYVVPFRGDSAAKELLIDTAVRGGTKNIYSADDPDALVEQLLAVLNNIMARASSGSAASVISSSRGGEGAIYQAVFWPRRGEAENVVDCTTAYPIAAQGEVSTATVEWAGDVRALFIDTNGHMFEDTDGDRQLTVADKRVITYFDEGYNETRACYPVKSGNVWSSCLDENAVTVSLDEIKYLWSANDWLAKISNNAFLSPGYDVSDQYLNRSDINFISDDRRRYIFTWNDLKNDGIVHDEEVIEFVSRTEAGGATTTWSTMLDGITPDPARNSVVHDFNVSTDVEVNNIVDWVRGVEIDGFRSRTITKSIPGVTPEPEIVWRLGDVIHSTPMAVSRPMENLHLLYGDMTYNTFVSRWAKRRHMSYFGANDGMLHAVNGGFYDPSQKKFCLTPDCLNEVGEPELGAELWAYVPYNLLPHLGCLTDVEYTHKYYVDQQPRIFDARIFDEEAACTTSYLDAGCIHPHGWGTILVGAMRFGGAPVTANVIGDQPLDARIFTSGYFVMDITNPEAPPKLLGELTMHAGDDNMGFTTASPTAVVMKDGAGAGEWYLVIGSGPTGADVASAIKGNSDQAPHVAVIPLRGLIDGKPFRLTSTDVEVIPLDESDNASKGFVSDLITVDFDKDPYYKSDAVYFGTVEGGVDKWGGKLYRLVMRDISTGPADWNVKLLYDADNPITAAPAIGTDLKNFWVYFGTGRFFDAGIDRADVSEQSFYGIKEPMACNGSGEFTWAEVTTGQLIDVSKEQIFENDASVKVTSFIDQIATGSPGCSKDALGNEYEGGWYRNFARTGERNLGQATLLGGLLTFTTYQPNEAVCETDGTSYLYGLHYQTGTPSFKSVFGDRGKEEGEEGKIRILESLTLGPGLATTANLHVGAGEGPTAFVQTSTGEIIEIPQTDLPESYKTGRRSWRER